MSDNQPSQANWSEPADLPGGWRRLIRPTPTICTHFTICAAIAAVLMLIPIGMTAIPDFEAHRLRVHSVPATATVEGMNRIAGKGARPRRELCLPDPPDFRVWRWLAAWDSHRARVGFDRSIRAATPHNRDGLRRLRLDTTPWIGTAHSRISHRLPTAAGRPPAQPAMRNTLPARRRVRWLRQSRTR